jgi:iron-sulfur cluster repair protein YtfE (RIC family)
MVESVTGIFGGGEGSQDATEILKADHDRVDALFQKVKANEDGNNKDVFQKLRQELEIHTHVEEQIFYPNLLENGDEELQKIVREGLEEHGQVKTLLVEMGSMSGDDEEFKAKLQVMMENVEHHVQEEEGEMFPLVKDQLDEEMLVRLGSLITAEKARIGGSEARSASASQ